MRGVFLDVKTLNREALDFSPLTSTLDKWEFFDQTTQDQISARIQDAHVIVTNKVEITAEHIAKADQLRCICISATGSDHVDIRAATDRNILVCNVVGYSTPSVIQHTIGLMIALAFKIVSYHNLVQGGAWHLANTFCLQYYSIEELAGKTLGIIGYGETGQGVAKIAQLLGMNILIAQRPGKNLPHAVPLDALLPQVDVLSLHFPLNAQTRQLIGKHELSLMKRSALLINVARGGIVDEQALAEALVSGNLGGAAIDVMAQEPPLPDNPLLALKIPNLIVTPHVAWSSLASQQRLLAEITANVKAFTANAPRNVVRPAL